MTRGGLAALKLFLLYNLLEIADLRRGGTEIVKLKLFITLLNPSPLDTLAST